MMERSRWRPYSLLAVGAGLMVVLSACMSNGESQDTVPPTPPTSISSEATAATAATTPATAMTTVTTEAVLPVTVSSGQDDVSFEIELLLLDDIELPPESLAPADGATVTVSGELTEPAELRLQLAQPPDAEAMPIAWHISDDGEIEMRTGMWDAERNELVVMTTEFSGWIPDWVNPVTWVAGVIDIVADMVSGRTDPPGCGDDPPSWASFVPPVGTGTVHSCFQSNIDNSTGVARAEVYFKSNRRGFQAVSIPAGKAYTWVEGQPDWIRPALANLTGTTAATSVVLPGGMATSFGFDQPKLTTEAQIAVYTTPGTIVMDGVAAAVGLATGADSGDIVAITVALNSCAASMFGVDVFQSDFTIDTDLDTALTGILACALEIIPELADPDKALAAVISLDDAGLLGPAPAGGYGAQLGALVDSASALGKIAERASSAIKIAGTGVYLWDMVLDNGIGNYPAQLTLNGSRPVDKHDLSEAIQGFRVIEVDGVPHGHWFHYQLSYPVTGIPQIDAAIEQYAYAHSDRIVGRMDSFTAKNQSFLSAEYPAVEQLSLEVGFLSTDLTSLTLTGYANYGGVGWDPNETLLIDASGNVVMVESYLTDGNSYAGAAEDALWNSALAELLAYEGRAGRSADDLWIESGQFNYGVDRDGSLAAHALPDTFGGAAFSSPTVTVPWAAMSDWLKPASPLARIAEGTLVSQAFTPVGDTTSMPFDYKPTSLIVYSRDTRRNFADTPNGEPRWSGCSPGTPDTLPDGIWMGFVTDWNNDGLRFDLACDLGVVFDSGCQCDFPNISNTNPSTRFLNWADNANIYAFDSTFAGLHGPATVQGMLDGRYQLLFPVSDSEWPNPPVLLYINGGVVTELEAIFWS